MKLNIKRGLWIVFTFNLLVGAIVWWAGTNVLKSVFESATFTEFVDSIPTLTIEDKTITNPLNLNTSRSLGDIPFLYVQTDRDYVGVGVIQDGVYITRKAVSIFNNRAVVAQMDLPEKDVINPERIHTYLHRFAIWAPAVLAVFYILRLWIFYLLVVALTALIALIPAIRKKLTPYAVWRYAMWAHVGVLGADFMAHYYGFGIPVLTYYNFDIPTWLGVTLLFFVSMGVQLAIAWGVSAIIMLIAICRNKNKKKKD